MNQYPTTLKKLWGIHFYLKLRPAYNRKILTNITTHKILKVANGVALIALPTNKHTTAVPMLITLIAADADAFSSAHTWLLASAEELAIIKGMPM